MQEAFLKNFEFIFWRISRQRGGCDLCRERMAADGAGRQTLWKEGTAPWILPSGRYSITKGKFSGVGR